MKPAIFHEEAEAEFRKAIAWHDNQRKGLGAELQAEVEAAVLRIRQHPLLFALDANSGTRRCLVNRFHYSIYFVELDDHYLLVAVAHQRQRPGYWLHRLGD